MSRIRHQAYELLEDPVNVRAARLLNWALIALIIANVAAILLDSVPSIHANYRTWLKLFEWFSIGLFTIEYCVRVWAAVEREDGKYGATVKGRIRYMFSPMAMIDLLAILPFYIGFLVPVDLRFMRIFRLFLIFKLTRYHMSMGLLARVVRHEAGPIGAALFVLSTLLIVASSFAYIVEHEAQPDVFASIPDAMWWAIVTMTTVGYGDMVPMTPIGKLLGGVIAVVGLGMVALPAGLLAAGFSEQLHLRKRAFEDEVHRMLTDGVISGDESQQLDAMRNRLGLTDQQALEIMRLITRRHTVTSCPRCGFALSK